MSARTSPPPQPQRRGPGLWDRQSHRRLLALAILLVIAAAALLGQETWRLGHRLVAGEPAEPLAVEDPMPLMVASPTAPTDQPAATLPLATVTPEPVLRLPGPVPARGRGTFTYAPGQGPVLGQGGELRRYRVAVEDGAGEDVVGFAVEVDRTLADPGSWIGGGRLRLQRVPDRGGYDFTVYLTTAQTTRRMCAAGGVDIRIGGRPYTSCRAAGKVIINLERWRRSVEHYVSAGVPLDVYRAYVLNHEVGHELGFRHERCPGRGRAAPVMMQQTLFLNGCVANPWPYLEGKRYAGPRL